MKFKEIAQILSGGGITLKNNAADLQETGWYRVCNLGTYMVADFGIVGGYNYNYPNSIRRNACCSYALASLVLLNEIHHPASSQIDKIRITMQDDKKKFLDIHYKPTQSNTVYFKIFNMGSIKIPDELYVPFTPVDDWPDGETILAEEEIL